MSTPQTARDGDRARLHPEAQATLDAARAAGRPPVYEQPLDRARAHLVAATRTDSPIPVGSVADELVNTAAGPIAVRVYHPVGATGRLPVVVYLHGGCWIIGDLDTHDADCRSIASRAHCVVVAVHYRLAPEHRFPAAVEDAVAALDWVVGEADRLGADPTRLTVAGVSAGGNLAAAAALAARDRGGPSLAAQVLVYPITDCDLDRESYRLFGSGYLLTIATMKWSWDLYAGDDRAHPLASPMRAVDHRGLPAALVMVAECDPLRDEGLAYADVLAAAGVEVTALEVEGQVHAFFSSPGRTESADAAHELVAGWLRQRWSGTTP